MTKTIVIDESRCNGCGLCVKACHEGALSIVDGKARLSKGWLCDGIGETIRVSLTADPVREIAAAQDILRAIGKRGGVQLVSCPTCGRTRIDLISAASRVEDALRGCEKDIKVAVMGCVVNGPGEAREADIGIAGGDGFAVLFRKGEVLRRVPEDEIVTALLEEVEKL